MIADRRRQKHATENGVHKSRNAPRISQYCLIVKASLGNYGLQCTRMVESLDMPRVQVNRGFVLFGHESCSWTSTLELKKRRGHVTAYNSLSRRPEGHLFPTWASSPFENTAPPLLSFSFFIVSRQSNKWNIIYFHQRNNNKHPVIPPPKDKIDWHSILSFHFNLYFRIISCTLQSTNRPHTR